MNTLGIVLYYSWLAIDLFLIYLFVRYAYTDEDFEDKIRVPIIIYLLAGIICLMPIINVIIGFVGAVLIGCAIYEGDLHIKHWLFKKI